MVEPQAVFAGRRHSQHAAVILERNRLAGVEPGVGRIIPQNAIPAGGPDERHGDFRVRLPEPQRFTAPIQPAVLMLPQAVKRFAHGRNKRLLRRPRRLAGNRRRRNFPAPDRFRQQFAAVGIEETHAPSSLVHHGCQRPGGKPQFAVIFAELRFDRQQVDDGDAFIFRHRPGGDHFDLDDFGADRPQCQLPLRHRQGKRAATGDVFDARAGHRPRMDERTEPGQPHKRDQGVETYDVGILHLVFRSVIESRFKAIRYFRPD